MKQIKKMEKSSENTTEKSVGTQEPAKERIKGMASNGSGGAGGTGGTGGSMPIPTPVPTPTPSGFRGKVAEKAGALKDKAVNGMQQLNSQPLCCSC